VTELSTNAAQSSAAYLSGVAVGGFQSALANGSTVSKNLPKSGSLGFINIDDQPGNMNGMFIIYFLYLNCMSLPR